MNSNNQALRSSSQQRAIAANQNQASSQPQTIQQQAARQKQPTRKPLDPDAEPDEDSATSDAKFECPRPDGLFADPGELQIFKTS